MIKEELGFNNNVVEFLKKEETLLREKATKMLENNDFAMYTKLINSYEKVVELVKKYDWTLMYSKYGKKVDNGIFIDCVSIWEQNDDTTCRNIKEFGRVDLEKIISNKGDKVVLNGEDYYAICVDNEYATFAKKKADGGVCFSDIMVLGNNLKTK